MASKFVLGDGEPPIVWDEQLPYENWKAAVLVNKELAEDMLLALYKECWQPRALHEALLVGGYFNKSSEKPRRRRLVLLDVPDVERRIAKAIWVECGRLLPRRMSLEARRRVCDLQTQMEKAAGIEVL